MAWALVKPIDFNYRKHGNAGRRIQARTIRYSHIAAGAIEHKGIVRNAKPVRGGQGIVESYIVIMSAAVIQIATSKIIISDHAIRERVNSITQRQRVLYGNRLYNCIGNCFNRSIMLNSCFFATGNLSTARKEKKVNKNCCGY